MGTLTKRERTLGPQPLSAGAAALRVVVTLLIFLGFFISFLLAPLITLGIGYLVYMAGRAHRNRVKPTKPALVRSTTQPASASGFGTGAA